MGNPDARTVAVAFRCTIFPSESSPIAGGVAASCIYFIELGL